MNATPALVAELTRIGRSSLSESAKQRLRSQRGEPLFYADWSRVVFIHYEADVEVLRREVPFELDLREGRPYVSLVAFTMRKLRPRVGGWLGTWLFRPIATHEFLNVRTYVRCGDGVGIYFLAEWLSNPLSVRLGPISYGLPYRFGRLHYDDRHEHGELTGCVICAASNERLMYSARLDKGAECHPCAADTLEEFLMERYSPFTRRGAVSRFFRIWHVPWPHVPIKVSVRDESLLAVTGDWIKHARFVGANYSPGVSEVWMGMPRRI